MADEQNNGGKKSNGMAIAALVCGILSLFFGVCLGFLGITAWIGVVLGIVAVVLGVMANKKEKDGKATGGLIMGIIGIVISAIFAIACTVCYAKADKEFKKAAKEIENMNWDDMDWGELEDALKDIDWSDLE